MDQYLQQILDELRAIRRLLEQGGVAPAILPAQHSSAATAASVRQSQPKNTAREHLKHYLMEKQLSLIEAEELPSPSSKKQSRIRLAYLIGQNYNIASELLDKLRTTLLQPTLAGINTSAEINVEHLTATERSTLANICTSLRNLGMLDKFERVRTGNRLSKLLCKVSKQPHARSYLSGEWFEWYIAEVVRRTLSTRASSVLRGVKLQRNADGQQLEIDVLFAVRSSSGYNIGVIECKSGKSINGSQMCEQVRLIASALDLSPNQIAVLTLDTPSAIPKQNCLEQAGVQLIGRNELEAFLRGMLE
jgi:hypothetical protein